MDENNFPIMVDASYSKQRLPHFRGNPLIEALPPSLTDEQLFNLLTRRPEFDSSQREWMAYERILMIGTLSNFTVPLTRHFELARALDSMLRNGYVGRAPWTPEHAKRFRADYPLIKPDDLFVPRGSATPPQLSGLLMGVSGMGKTTIVDQCLSYLPKVIYHEKYNLYQVTRLHVEMPSDGSSIKGLAAGILHQLDQLIPGARYFETYSQRGRASADTLMRSVARVLNSHCVGFIVADEIQNLTNSKKSAQTVMTELVSACNDLGVPLLFIGTNKAAQVFSLNFRKSRRASGHGISEWPRLSESVANDEVDEWRDFLEILWSFQWSKNPVPLDDELAHTMYHYSQGVIDVAIKIFASAQARAILDGTEKVTSTLLACVYNKEMKMLHPMIEALRSGNLEALLQFDDIAPVSVAEIMSSYARKSNIKLAEAYSVKATDKSFSPRLTTSLMSAGFSEEESAAVAAEIAEGPSTTTLADGVKEAIRRLEPVKRVRKTSVTKSLVDNESVENFDNRPCDYRRATALSKTRHTKVIVQMNALGMLQPLHELVDV